MIRDYLESILTADVYAVARETPLDRAERLSQRLGCNVLLKREDQQPTFSFKLRGAYNKIARLDPLSRVVDRGNVVVAVGGGRPVAGVVLRAAEHSGLHHSPVKGQDMSGNHLPVGTKGALADDAALHVFPDEPGRAVSGRRLYQPGEGAATTSVAAVGIVGRV